MNLHNYIVQIRRGTKRITLQRFLISKIAYKKDFSEIELAALFHNQLWLSTKAATDRDFEKKFGSDLESINKILTKINFSRGLSEGSLANFRKALLALSWDFLFPKRNISTIEAQLRNSIYTRWREPEGVEVSRLPPEKYIGKGYRDKGTAQRPEYDANPAWQEVASASANLERNLEEAINAIKEEDDLKTRLQKLERVQSELNRLKKITSARRNS